ncbi:Ammonia transport outward protein 2 [Candida viswanathii]|uniref:Ammonia transport outward protein 2 n=1 Tax=Candida viswanathii TaxID=5486 RepID=A0A367XY67_9ASCO|nr:Ammonia transport outward protein 2 [Candida viswanathii]
MSSSLRSSQSMHSKTNTDDDIQAISFAGEGDEYVVLGGKKYYRHELMRAFVGNLNPGVAPYPEYNFGNASAIGLASFAMTTLSLDCTHINAGVGLFIFYGGLVEFLAGIWEFFNANTFAYVVFCSFGSFWICLGTMSVPSFGILAAYEDDPSMRGSAIGFFFIAWGVFTFMMLIITVKATVPFIGLFASLDAAFFVLAAAYITDSRGSFRGGGVLCVISACCGWYGMFAGVADRFNSYFTVEPLQVPVYEKRVWNI